MQTTAGRNPKIAAVLAFVSVVSPITGLHKFYVGQPGWGLAYLLLSWTPVPRIASIVEGIWYLTRTDYLLPTVAPGQAPASMTNPQQVKDIVGAVRELDRLRQEGLMTELEFEQKRRALLDRVQ